MPSVIGKVEVLWEGHKKGYKIGNKKIDLGEDSPVSEKESWNFQQIKDFLKPHKISAPLDNFFHSFQGGTKRKKKLEK